jgi:hypothetical protein
MAFPVYLIRAIGLYAVDIPVWDEWGLLSLFEKYYEGGLDFAEFWAQNNEHRLLFPKLLFLGLGVLSRYNTIWEMYASVVLAGLLWGLACRQVYANRALFGLERAWIWFLPAASALVFSLRQHENWFWGFQVQWYMNALAVAAGAYLYANLPLSPALLAGLFVCGLAALFSLSSGVLYWPIMLVFLLLRRPEPGAGGRLRYAAAWIALSGAAMLAYLHGYTPPPHHGGVTTFLTAPLEYARYVLLYCGALLGQMQDEWWGFALLGLAGLLVFTVGSVLFSPFSSPRFRAASFFMIVGLYGIGCGLLTGVGRLKFGVGQASSSRYATMSMLLWLVVLFWGFAAAGALRLRGKALSAAAVWTLCLLLALGATWRSTTCVSYILYASLVYEQGREAFLRGGPDELLANITWDPQSLKTRAAPFFKKHRLSVFRDQPAP